MRAMTRALAGDVLVLGFGFMEVDTDAEASELAGQLSEGFDDVADRAAGIEPPPDVERAHRRAVAALRAEAERYDRFARSGRAPVPALGRDELSAALLAIERRGYDIGWD